MVDITTYYFLIGRVVVELQSLEYSYKQFFHVFLDEEFKYSNDDNRFYNLLKTLKSKIKIKYDKREDVTRKLIPIINESIRLNKKRNEIIHSYWITYSSNNREIMINYRDRKPDNLKLFVKDGIVFPNENYKLLTLEEIIRIGDKLQNNHAKLFAAYIPFAIERGLKNPYINKEALLDSWKGFINIKDKKN